MACLLKARFGCFLATYALKCASWTGINRGTSQRSPCASLGFSDYRSVAAANRMACRTPDFRKLHFRVFNQNLSADVAFLTSEGIQHMKELRVKKKPSILFMEKILHQVGCPKTFFYIIGAGFFPTVYEK